MIALFVPSCHDNANKHMLAHTQKIENDRLSKQLLIYTVSGDGISVQIQDTLGEASFGNLLSLSPLHTTDTTS